MGTRLGRDVLVLVVAGLLVPAAVGGAAVPKADVVALGDSYTVALRSGAPCAAGALCPANSWVTGTNAAVNSHLRRIKLKRPATTAMNLAVSARKMADMNGQAKKAVLLKASYVTLMAGLNDACRESEGAMTPVAAFRSSFGAALATLTTGLPRARVFVASIPDPYRFWEALRNDPAARAQWAAAGTCTVMLANPLSTAPQDVARRARARQRVIGFNAALAAVCAAKPQCRFDKNAVFNWDFTPADISVVDHFHLSVIGERNLAALTYPLAQPPF